MIEWKDVPEEQQFGVRDPDWNPPDDTKRCQAAVEFYTAPGSYHRCGGFQSHKTRFCGPHSRNPPKSSIWKRKFKRIITILKE